MLKSLLPILVFLPIAVFSQSLDDVPLVEDSLGMKKKFKIDASHIIPKITGEKIPVYTYTHFCYKGKRFSLKKRFASSKFTYTHKYLVPLFIEIKAESYEGTTYCILKLIPHQWSTMQCNPKGFKDVMFDCSEEDCTNAKNNTCYISN